MNIDQPLKDLGSIDYEPLRDAIINLDKEAWHENETRQEIFDVHKKTSSLMLVFCDGWPEIKVTKEEAWDRLAKVAVPVMQMLSTGSMSLVEPLSGPWLQNYMQEKELHPT